MFSSTDALWWLGGSLVVYLVINRTASAAVASDAGAGSVGDQIDTLAVAIFQAEESGRMNAANNPGNLRAPDGSIRRFATPAEGWAALRGQLVYDFVDQRSTLYSPAMTFRELAWMWVCGGSIGAPCGPSDLPDSWASTVAVRCGVDVTSTVGEFLA